MKRLPSKSNIVLMFCGACEALLLARFIARSLAARPDNPSIVLLYRLTEPLVAPLRALDYGQPLYGAVIELSTLTLAILLPLLLGIGWIWWQQRNYDRAADV